MSNALADLCRNGGTRVTFSGRRVYAIKSYEDLGGWLRVDLKIAPAFGAYPNSPRGNRGYHEWLQDNAQDPLCDEVLGGWYWAHFLTGCEKYCHAVEVRNPGVHGELSLELRLRDAAPYFK